MQKFLRAYLPLLCIVAVALVVAVLLLIAVPAAHLSAIATPDILIHNH